VGGRLHRGTTQVQGRTAFAQRGELADLSGTGVIEAQTHVVKPIPFPCTAASQTTAPYCLGEQRAPPYDPGQAHPPEWDDPYRLLHDVRLIVPLTRHSRRNTTYLPSAHCPTRREATEIIRKSRVGTPTSTTLR